MKADSGEPLDVDDDEYLGRLNECFGHWGDRRQYDWVFHRPFAGHSTDRLILREEGKALAGSAISWRELLDAQGERRLVGIMTGSWTVPEARGKGCFTRMIEASRERCMDRQAHWLLAFVTDGNPSRKALEREGSSMVPTHYLWSPEASEWGNLPIDIPPHRVSDAADWYWRERGSRFPGSFRFHYRTFDLWRGQFLERPLPTELMHFEGLGHAIVERHPVFDRVLSTLPERPEQRIELETVLGALASRAEKRFFTFTSCPSYAAEIRGRLKLDGTSGFITILPGQESAPSAASPWSVESGDRM